MKSRQKQINIVVRYLCSKQTNKDGCLVITHKDIQFLAQHGCDLGFCLQELKNRGYIKYHAPAIFVRNPTTFEIELLPLCYQHFKKITSRQMSISILSVITAITTTILGTTGSLNNIVDFISKLTPQEKYEISAQWIDNQEALRLVSENDNQEALSLVSENDNQEPLSLVSEKSKITFTSAYNSDCFYDGVSLFALFTNTTDIERQIVSFTISATDIVEDLSPLLFAFGNQYGNVIALYVHNNGWSETGSMGIAIENISPPRLTPEKGVQNEDENATSIAQVFLHDSLLCSSYSSIEAGTRQTIPLITTDAFDIIWNDTSVRKFYFDVTGRLYSLDNDYSCDFSFRMEASHDGVKLAENAMGGDEPIRNHVVVIDTSQENWTKTYNVYQPLPAKQTIRLPIFIFPTKTCTMSLKVTFEMSDGETLEAQWLDNQRFAIFYYEELSDNLTNLFENWNDISNETIIYMPE